MQIIAAHGERPGSVCRAPIQQLTPVPGLYNTHRTLFTTKWRQKNKIFTNKI